MTFVPKDFTVWAEIPVTDLDRGISFYNAVFNLDLQKMEMGPNEMAMFPMEDKSSVAGHLYPGKPAPEGTGPTVHFACPENDLDGALSRVKDAGGKVLSDPIAIPAGQFVYCTDVDGNSISIFAQTATDMATEGEA